MPFTFAHPAILLPFRKYLSITGLIIGCMSPDFEYFLRFKIYSAFSHTFLGIFLFCVPISILVSILFHQIIRNPLIDNLPNYFYVRTIKFKKFNWLIYLQENKTKVIISILLGAFSHIFWDSFTHDDGFFVNEFKILKSVFYIDQYKIPILKILQHLSTIAGFIYIIYIFNQLPKSNQLNNNINLKYYLSIIILSICLIIGVSKIDSNSLKIGNLIVVSISSIFITILITSIAYKTKKQPL